MCTDPTYTVYTVYILYTVSIQYKLSDNYGDLNKVLAAEWAKFRWGVFDDSPPPNAGRDFYATQSFVEASKCSLEIKEISLLFK